MPLGNWSGGPSVCWGTRRCPVKPHSIYWGNSCQITQSGDPQKPPGKMASFNYVKKTFSERLGEKGTANPPTVRNVVPQVDHTDAFPSSFLGALMSSFRNPPADGTVIKNTVTKSEAIVCCALVLYLLSLSLRSRASAPLPTQDARPVPDGSLSAGCS